MLLHFQFHSIVCTANSIAKIINWQTAIHSSLYGKDLETSNRVQYRNNAIS